MIKQLCMSGILALLALPAAAQGPAGRWAAGIDTRNGRFPLTFEFLVKGDQLTGSVSNEYLPKFPMQEGTVKGNELSFKLKLQFVTLAYKGVLKGDELTLKSSVVEERPSSSQQSLGGVLRTADVITATRAK